MLFLSNIVYSQCCARNDNIFVSNYITTFHLTYVHPDSINWYYALTKTQLAMSCKKTLKCLKGYKFKAPTKQTKTYLRCDILVKLLIKLSFNFYPKLHPIRRIDNLKYNL